MDMQEGGGGGGHHPSCSSTTMFSNGCLPPSPFTAGSRRNSDVSMASLDHPHAHEILLLPEEDMDEGEADDMSQPLSPLLPPPSSLGSEKVIHLIRHGQSEYNLHYQLTGKDPMIFDADLTPLGVEQATALREQVASLGVELAVTTPLRRAIRTCLLSLPHEDNHLKVTYEVWHQHRELLEASCDLGSDLPALQADFPSLNFNHLPPVWWFFSEDCNPKDPDQCRQIFREQGYIEPYDVFKRRVDELAVMLRQRKERVIALYGHGDFFHCFLRSYMGIKNYWMENCEIVTGRLIR